MFTVVFLVFGIIQNGGEFDNVAEAQARYDEIVADDPNAVVYLFNDEAETTSAQIVATNDPKWLEMQATSKP